MSAPYELTWEGSRDPQDARLMAALLDAQRRLAALRERPKLDDEVTAACERCLRRADHEAHRSRYVAWDCLHQFDEEALGALDDMERAARWCSLRAEAASKLGGTWRGAAAEGLARLADQAKGGNPQAVVGGAAPLQLLRELHSQLATAAQNKQHRLELFQRGSLPWVALWLIVLVVAALAASFVVFATGAPAALAPWAGSLLLGMPAGIVGGVLSLSFSLGTVDLSARIPELRLSRLVTLMRPLLGAAVALPVAVLVHAGAFRIASLEVPLAVVAVCFVAGFSERWFLGAMERLAESAR